MDHNRRARPTLRVLREDLPDGWEKKPAVLRAIAEQQWERLQPLSELPHLILRKAKESYGSNPGNDPTARPIASSKDLRLLELRASQWRAGIWTDPQSGVRWVCAAGLAKGDHADHEDFYERVKATVDNGNGSRLLPTELDLRLLDRETVAQLLTDWELAIQSEVRAALEQTDRTSAIFTIPHPRQPTTMATVEITVGTEDADLEEYVVEIELSGTIQASRLAWVLIRRVLTSVAPSAQEWDRYDFSFSQMAEPGHRAQQIRRLSDAATECELLAHEPGKVSHYGHQPHLAGSAVNGSAVRALCGVFFVVGQDHIPMQVCPDCSEQYAQLPG